MGSQVFYNGVVHTVDRDDRTVEAFRVTDGRISAVGSTADLLAAADANTERVDLAGKCVIPGLTDVHTHLLKAATVHGFWTDIYAPPVKNIPEMLEKLRSAATIKQPGEWVLGIGGLLYEEKLEEGRYPTRAELDTVSTDHPIVLRLAGHVHILNSKAIEVMGIPRDVQGPQSGVIGRDPNGELTGLFIDAHQVLTLPEYDFDSQLGAVVSAAKHYFLRFGITAIGDMAVAGRDLALFRKAKSEGRLPLRVAYFPLITSDQDIDGYISDNAQGRFDVLDLGMAGLKVFADGGLSARNAAIHGHYCGTQEQGNLGFSEEEFRKIVARSITARLQLAIHAAGDRAFDFVAKIIQEELDKSAFPDHRFRIEHVSHPYMTDERVGTMARLGLVPSPQIPHLYSMGDHYPQLLGDETMPLALRLRSMIDHGLRPAGSSDLTGSQPESSDPFLSMWVANRRRAQFGTTYGEKEAITIADGLRMYTVNSARAIRQEHERGSIEVGKVADFAILDRDLLGIEIDDVPNIRVEQTYIAGESVYHHGE